MQIHQNTGGLAATNAYLIADEAARVAVLIDAPGDTILPLLKIAQYHHWDIPLLLLTHGHWDHISDHKIFSQAYPQARILIHRLDEAKLKSPGSMMFQLPYTIEPRSADGYIEDGAEFQVGAIKLRAIFTPGHAPGHVAFYGAENKLLLAGDLLFAGSIGRTDLPDSDPAAMARSLAAIVKLPSDTAVRPGHGPPTTIGEELKSNPYIAR